MIIIRGKNSMKVPTGIAMGSTWGLVEIPFERSLSDYIESNLQKAFTVGFWQSLFGRFQRISISPYHTFCSGFVRVSFNVVRVNMFLNVHSQTASPCRYL